jgi:hypothetical protein
MEDPQAANRLTQVEQRMAANLKAFLHDHGDQVRLLAQYPYAIPLVVHTLSSFSPKLE